MGQYASLFVTPDSQAVSKLTHPSKPNWITAHAIHSELSIAEVERLWVRFQQLGCNKDGELTEETIRKADFSNDVFMKNIMRKYMSASTKKITFENFLRALKWCEQASVDDKIKAIYQMLNNGNPVNAELCSKILERVYPGEKGEPIQRIVEIFFKVMDRNGKGVIDEAGFVYGVKKIPPDVLQNLLNFQILPDQMKHRLHQNLQEFRSDSANPWSPSGNPPPPQARLTPGRAKRVPPDAALREVAEKIHKRDWARVANKLGLFGDDIEEIDRTYPNSQHKAYQMLKQWKERDGNMAYAEVLEKALLESDMADAAIIITSY